MLRREEAPPNKDGKGNPFSMHQLRFLFNGARLPGEGEGGLDKVTNYFKTGNKYSMYQNETTCKKNLNIRHYLDYDYN